MAARVLVAFATKMGSTGQIAESIAGTLRAAGLDVEARRAGEVLDVEPYDAIVLGSALYAAHWQREANRFVNRNREGLRIRPLWLFSSGPLDRRLAARNLPINEHASQVLGDLTWRDHRTFGGRLDPAAPGVDAQILQTHQVGDFRDWAAIHDYAAAIAREILAAG
jgi:menaquinone-dependent protoporphyrinogen oxidase